MTRINKSYPDKFQHISFQNVFNLAKPTIFCLLNHQQIEMMSKKNQYRV